jgi:cellulose biosynthesis protein BcsQ
VAAPVLTFFNNKDGVGKTSLVYHLAWMYADLGHNVIVADLDPQSNLTCMFLDEGRLEKLCPDNGFRKTIYGAIQPLLDGTGDITAPYLERIDDNLNLILGDLRLSSTEDELSSQWRKCLNGCPRAFRVISALWRILRKAGRSCQADVILVDVSPSLGALNRAALIATDYVVVPLGSDLLSLQALRNLGPVLRNWRNGWKDRYALNPLTNLEIPDGEIQPIGYLAQQHGVILSHPIKAHDKWVNRIPAEYARNMLGQEYGYSPPTPADDVNALGTFKHYRSLVPLAREVRKPIFNLTPADGARGSHAAAVMDSYNDFKKLADKIYERMSSTKKPA